MVSLKVTPDPQSLKKLERFKRRLALSPDGSVSQIIFQKGQTDLKAEIAKSAKRLMTAIRIYES